MVAGYCWLEMLCASMLGLAALLCFLLLDGVLLEESRSVILFFVLRNTLFIKDITFCSTKKECRIEIGRYRKVRVDNFSSAFSIDIGRRKNR